MVRRIELIEEMNYNNGINWMKMHPIEDERYDEEFILKEKVSDAIEKLIADIEETTDTSGEVDYTYIREALQDLKKELDLGR